MRVAYGGAAVSNFFYVFRKELAVCKCLDGNAIEIPTKGLTGPAGLFTAFC